MNKNLPIYPKNSKGDFVVEDGFCIACGAPEAAAPDLMDHDQNEKVSYHCYFKKQPSNPQELEQAIDAVRNCCCDSVQYIGNDPEIMKRISAVE